MELSSRHGKVLKYFLLVISFILITPLFLYGDIKKETQPGTKVMPFQGRQLKTIIVNDYYPYTYINEEGIPDGFSVDLIKAVTQVMGLELHIRTDTWEYAVRALKKGEIDLLPMMAYSIERDIHFDFSVAHTIAYDAFFTRKDSKKIRSIKDLHGKSIIVMKDDQAHDYLRSSSITELENIILIDSLPDALRLLASGRGDAALMPKLVGLIVIEKLNLTNLEQSPMVIEAYQRPFSFAVKGGNQSLLERLNQGLGILKTTKQYKTIYTRWFGAIQPQGYSLRTVLKYIFGIILAFILLGAVLLLWSFSLRKQVALRTRSLEVEINERKKTEEALIESEERYRTLFESTPEGILSTGSDNTIVSANPASASIFGYGSPEELIGLPIIEVYNNPEDRERMLFEINKEGYLKDNEIVIKRKNNDLRTLFITLKIIKDDNGNKVRIDGIFRDVTEKLQLESQLRQTYKMEAIGTLAGGVAHDFNNILGIIIGNTELVIDDTPDWNPVRANLEEVKIAGLRARDIVRQLLSFSRKKVDQKRKPIKIHSIVKESISLIRSSIPATIDIYSNIPDDLGTIEADSTQIHQVLINLCTNAAHAMEEDGGVLEISLSNMKLDEESSLKYQELSAGLYVRLTIKDTGHGIDPGIKERLFEPYFTTKEIDKGTGIGLAVVHGIVKNHLGAISIFSEPGNGTTVEVLFPVIDEEPVLDDKSTDEIPKGKEKILFIDDEVSLVKMGEQMLKRLGYIVETQTNPMEALELIRSDPFRYDLMITDMTMPQMTGDCLVKEVLKVQPNLPIILCTGFNNKINEVKAREMGIRKYIEKPMDRHSLAFGIREVLDG